MSGGASVLPLPKLKKKNKERPYSRHDQEDEDAKKISEEDKDIPKLIREFRERAKNSKKEESGRGTKRGIA